MDNRTESAIHIGLGFANRADAFQSGREAAQMALSQVPEGIPELVMVFGPGDAHFQNFIEGVRLVTGEETLVGVPVRRILSPDVSAPDACATLVVRSTDAVFSIASADIENDAATPAATSLFTQIRHQRGNARRAFDFSGLLVFENGTDATRRPLAEEITADAGLQSWLLGSRPTPEGQAGLICRNRSYDAGAVAVECLTNAPWGLSTVSVGVFKDRPDIHREAVRTAMRDARSQIQGAKPALGLLFFDFPIESFDQNDLLDLLESAISVVPNTPLIGIPTGSHFSRSAEGSILSERDSVAALLVPR